MAYDAPYRVEHYVEEDLYGKTWNVYEIVRVGEDLDCKTKSLVFAHKIVDLLNEHENGRDIHR